MTSDKDARSAAQVLIRQLELNGIEHIFCVPGESYLPVLDALVGSPISVTVCRQEGGAAMMAEAHGKLTGRPAVCMVTRGPGATNAMPGIHIAQHDSTPLLLFVGQVERGMRGRGALQEMDYEALFGSVAKWVVEIDDADRIPEMISRAMHMSMSGRPGPVVLSLPEDMLAQLTHAPDAPAASLIAAHPAPHQIERVGEMLARAQRPVAILGGSRWTPETFEQFARLAEDWGLPTTVSLRRQMLISTEHPAFIGDLGFGTNPKLVEIVADADLILAIGTRLSEVPSQSYTLLDIPSPKQTLIHVHPDPSELGRVYAPTLGIAAAPSDFVGALAELSAVESDARPAFLERARAEYLRWRDPGSVRTPGRLQMAEIMTFLNDTLPPDAILCNGAGNFATWVHRFYRFRAFATQLAPTSGSMGYGVPAAIGAKRLWPGKTVIAFAGDGDFLMNGQEFATAVQYDLPIIVILVDNGMYGTIRMHQERDFPGRVIATDLRNPDFAAYAAAFGGFGVRVEDSADFPDAFARAVASGKPAIIHCILDKEAITPARTLTEIRESAAPSP
ncbi:MAG: thiamine pyrophosphate-binding protein [Alphaproteobacteria bacterium HGW-Alphaproteobacteria-5]|jgi:acetolactate synthase-1/2/3 large subunit|nr:MAG: thiamine pyrophosphate-binding protein [Alphaproteobacteria bacterium HGW-Alphaproteobacteria-5]